MMNDCGLDARAKKEESRAKTKYSINNEQLAMNNYK